MLPLLEYGPCPVYGSPLESVRDYLRNFCISVNESVSSFPFAFFDRFQQRRRARGGWGINGGRESVDAEVAEAAFAILEALRRKPSDRNSTHSEERYLC